MKKTLVLALCLLIAVFAFTSCNNDTRVPENENGETTNPDTGDSTESINPKVLGKWAEDSSNPYRDTLTFYEDGTAVYSGITGTTSHDTEYKFYTEGDYIYFLQDISLNRTYEVILNKAEGTLEVFSTSTAPDIYKFENGTPESILGLWSGEKNGATEGDRKDTIKITESTITESYFLNGILMVETCVSYTLDENKLTEGTGTGTFLFGKYDSNSDKLIIEEGNYNFIRL